MHVKKNEKKNLRCDLASINYFNDVLRCAYDKEAYLYQCLQEVGAYYSGENGLHMNKYGPVVKLGPKPYPLTPCAHSFYETQITVQKDKFYLQDGVALHDLRVYCAVMGLLNERVKCFLLAKGFIVRLDEYYLLKTHISQYCKSLLELIAAKSVSAGALKQQKVVAASRRNIAEIAIRSLWPGNTHRVFGSPAQITQLVKRDLLPADKNSNSSEIIEFHKVRLIHMKRYLQKVWTDVTYDIVKETGGTCSPQLVPSYDYFARKKFIENRFRTEMEAEQNAIAVDLGANKMWFKQWYKRSESKRLKYGWAVTSRK
jgi:hypothetical protein